MRMNQTRFVTSRIYQVEVLDTQPVTAPVSLSLLLLGSPGRSQTVLSTSRNCLPRKHLAKPSHILGQDVHIRIFYLLSPLFWGYWLLLSSGGTLMASCFLLPSEFHRCGHIRNFNPGLVTTKPPPSSLELKQLPFLPLLGFLQHSPPLW